MTNRLNNQPTIKRGFAARMDYYRKLALAVAVPDANSEFVQAHKTSLFIRADVRRAIKFNR